MTNKTINNVPRELLDSLLTVIESNGYAADEVEVADELRALLSAPSPAGVDGLELEARIVWLECESQVSAAPVSEAKAQCVIDFVFSGELPNATFVEVEDGNGNSINVGEWFKRDDGYSVLRLNAAPIQQVSVPDVSAMARILADRSADACNVNREDNWAIHGQDYIDDVTAMLAAALSAGHEPKQCT